MITRLRQALADIVNFECVFYTLREIYPCSLITGNNLLNLWNS
jgi:hypothetical protein